MAEVIAAMRSHRSVYDWKLWTNGKAYRATKGVDFTVTPASFRSTLHVHAFRHGLKVAVTIDGNAVEFQFSKSRRAK